MQCPVCQKTCGQNETFCSRCAWEFKMFVGEAPPEEEQRLKIARRNWKLLLAKASSTAKNNKKDVSDQSEPEKVNPKTISQARLLYSPDTPVPDLNLKRDAFETIKEFRERIANCRFAPVIVGKAKLLKEKYDITTGVFPVKITWMNWADQFVSETNETHIKLEGNLARSIYESGHEHPVYALWGLDMKQIVVYKIEIYALEQPFKIEKLIFYSPPIYPLCSEPNVISTSTKISSVKKIIEWLKSISFKKHSVFTKNSSADDSKKDKFLYSENKPVPDLYRDTFENFVDFQKRITNHNPVLAGQAELLKDNYNIDTSVFPVKITWKKWAETFVYESKKIHFIVERGLARSIYEAGREHPVYAFFKAGRQKAIISKIELYALNQPFKIEMSIFDKNPIYPRRSKPINKIKVNERRFHFNLDNEGHPKNYVKNEFELIRNDKVVIDHATGLMWRQSGSGKLMEYSSIKYYINNLNSFKFSGFNDWRLPTIDELTSLITKNKHTNKLHIDPIFNNKQKQCWSSDKGTSKKTAFFVNFKNGLVHGGYFHNCLYVRAVRSG